MNALFWNGEMDFGWYDLSIFLNRTCNTFVSTMQNLVPFSPNPQVENLISFECMERYSNLTSLLSENIREADTYLIEDLDNKSQNAIKLNSWIILGSLTEALLQIFIAFDNYKDTNWKQWDSFDKETMQDPIIQYIQELADNNIISVEQSRSFKKAIRATVKEHTSEHAIERVMIDELIQLYTSLQ